MFLTVEIYHGGAWHEAAYVALAEPSRGRFGASTFEYDVQYFMDYGAEALYGTGQYVIDARAASVAYPVDVSVTRTDHWPGFLVDLLPQGNARRRLVRELGFETDGPHADVDLLLRAAGSPIGNLRVREAYLAEQARLQGIKAPSLSLDDMFGRSDQFREMADSFALIASGSRGLQGEWPKIAMTKASDNLWYPDSMVPDAEAREHIIVKFVKSSSSIDEEILSSEVGYLEIARAFGLKVASKLEYANGVLIIPRFDRAVTSGGVVRVGQESLYSVRQIADASDAYWTHEDHLSAILSVVSDQRETIIEYVLRDVLNIACGNPDNHGRNTAIHRHDSGKVTLAPLFDFAPMRLAAEMISRTTKWACMRQLGRDSDPDWDIVCNTVAVGYVDVDELREEIRSREDFIRSLPKMAGDLGLPESVIQRAMGASQAVADRIGEMAPAAAKPKKG